ncbi:MAG: TorD/DmsD family molecular chaperone [Trueperaceae bacterium]
MKHDATARPVASADAIAQVLQLVAATYRSPDAALRNDLDSGAFATAVAELAEAAGLTAPTLGEIDWPKVQTAYVALFVTNAAGVPAPPYVGLALDGELLGPSAAALKAFLAHHGVEAAAGWHDLPDHVAAVAEAGALLADAGRDDAACVVLERFLSPWFQRYAPQVVAADVNGFYGPLTEFFASLLSEVSCEAAA